MRRVRRRRLAARTITIKVRDHRFHTVTLARRTDVLTWAPRTVYRAAAGLLDRWLSDHGNTPVRLLGVGVSKLEVSDSRGTVGGRGNLDAAIDGVTDRFGSRSLTRGLALSPLARPDGASDVDEEDEKKP